MSFQGPGTGISGYSAQFTVGYANTAGNINGYAPSAGYANQGAATAANIQSAQGINGSSWAWSGQPGTPGWLWGSNASGQYAVWQPANITVGYATNSGYSTQSGTAGYAQVGGNINGYAPSAGYATNAGYASNAGSAGYSTNNGVQYAGPGGNIQAGNWAWQGQNGTPNHFWGSNQGTQMYVWQAGQMTVGTANYTNGNIGGYAPVAGNINGYAPVSGCLSANQASDLRGFYLYGRTNSRLRGTGDDVCIYGGQTNFPGNGGNAAIGITKGNFGRIAATGFLCYSNNSIQQAYAYDDGYQYWISCDKAYSGENGWVQWWVCNYFLL